MPLLSLAQQIELGRKHGFTEAELPDWAAVIATESGGWTDRVQGRPGGDLRPVPGLLGRGLVQIDLGQHPQVTEEEAFDPDFAAAFARKLSRNKSGLGPTNWYGPGDQPAVADAARARARALLTEGRTVLSPFVSRSEWGAATGRPLTALVASQVTIHWAGTPSGEPAHENCGNVVRSFQRFHIETQGWADIAYNLIVCAHGYIFEGRGVGKRSAANGDIGPNSASYAICYLLGKGEPFTDAAKNAINDAAELLVPGGATWTVHRRWTGSECPGETIIGWVNAGHPSVGAQPVVERKFVPGTFVITNTHAQRAIDLAFASQENGGSVILFRLHGQTNQLVRLEPAGDGYVVIRFEHSGKVLDMDPGTLRVGQYADVGEHQQHWSVTPVTNGFVIVNRLRPDLALDVLGAAVNDGANVGVWSRNDGPAQVWTFTAL